MTGILLLVGELAVLAGSPLLVRRLMAQDAAPERFGGSLRAWVPVLGFGAACTVAGALVLAGIWEG